jgi:hypothetical protein
VVQERLHAHGLQYEILDSPLEVRLQEFVVDSVTTAPREYEGHRGQDVWGAYREVTRTLEPGTMRVPMTQPLARVAFDLLEPRSDDGFVAWGFMGEVLEAGKAYPVLRAFPGKP